MRVRSQAEDASIVEELSIALALHPLQGMLSRSILAEFLGLLVQHANVAKNIAVLFGANSLSVWPDVNDSPCLLPPPSLSYMREVRLL